MRNGRARAPAGSPAWAGSAGEQRQRHVGRALGQRAAARARRGSPPPTGRSPGRRRAGAWPRRRRARRRRAAAARRRGAVVRARAPRSASTTSRTIGCVKRASAVSIRSACASCVELGRGLRWREPGERGDAVEARGVTEHGRRPRDGERVVREAADARGDRARDRAGHRRAHDVGLVGSALERRRFQQLGQQQRVAARGLEARRHELRLRVDLGLHQRLYSVFGQRPRAGADAWRARSRARPATPGRCRARRAARRSPAAPAGPPRAARARPGSAGSARPPSARRRPPAAAAARRRGSPPASRARTAWCARGRPARPSPRRRTPAPRARRRRRTAAPRRWSSAPCNSASKSWRTTPNAKSRSNGAPVAGEHAQTVVARPRSSARAATRSCPARRAPRSARPNRPPPAPR